ncbi:MBL fold metallo-hydrolase [Lysinibacillus sp. UGB7]|uniref:MBL fold metallo-hydrolase n=1 Tax=Lysinibacillus sp. UGB7 TaxID=3411039 RepID=UPI003B822BC9
MNYYICETCGAQYEISIEVPKQCTICSEERQFVSVNGQTWTTLDKMTSSQIYKNNINLEEDGLSSITTSPTFGIGQTAYLIQEQGFNLLWDCISYIDQETIDKIEELGGVDAIALSHPHYYSSQVEWAETFNATIYIHEDDKEWITRSSDKIIFWSGESLTLQNGLTLYRAGGHFKGATILEWKNGYQQKGILFVGDIIRVVADRNWVTFMYSFPNFIPLPVNTVKRILNQVENLHFEQIYDAFLRIVKKDAKQSVHNSAIRYINALEGKLFNT